MIEGISTLYYINNSKDSKSQQLLQSLLLLPEHLHNKLEQIKSKSTPDDQIQLAAPSENTNNEMEDEETETFDDNLEEEFQIPEPLNPLLVQLELWPSKDLVTLREELNIINLVTRQVIFFFFCYFLFYLFSTFIEFLIILFFHLRLLLQY